MSQEVPAARTEAEASKLPPAQVQPEASHPTAEVPWRGFTTVWTLGFREIYTVWLPRGRSDVSDVAIGRWQTWVRWLGSSYGPSLATIAVLEVCEASSLSSTHILLLLLLGTINGGMFAGAVQSWKYALRRAHTLDELLGPCRNRESLIRVIAVALRHRNQLVLPLVFAVLPWIGLLTSDSHWLTSTAGLLILVNCTWSLALLGNVSYWLIVPPLLVIRLRASRELPLRWNDPARTAGIRTFSEGYAFPAVFLALGALAVTIPGVFDRPVFGRLLPYLYLWLITLSLWNGVATQLAIYSIIRRYRLRVLDELAEDSALVLAEDESASLPAKVKQDQELGAVLSAYGSIAGAPGLPYGTALVVQYVAAVVGSVVGFLLQ